MSENISKSEAMADALEFLKKEDKAWVTCPSCLTGKFGGIFYHTCKNPECILYDKFSMQKCGICTSPRYECCC